MTQIERGVISGINWVVTRLTKSSSSIPRHVFTAFLLTVLLTPVTAIAETKIRTKIIFFANDRFPVSERTRFVNDIKNYVLSTTGIRLDLRVQNIPTDPTLGYESPKLILTRLRAIKDWLIKKRLISKNRLLVHVITSPIIYPEGGHGINGWTRYVCSYPDGFSYGYSNADINGRGYLFSLMAATHEILHQIGAPHINSATLMNPDPWQFVSDQLLSVDRQSIVQIRDCLS